MDTCLCFAISHLPCSSMQIIIKHNEVVYFMYFKQRNMDTLFMYVNWNVSSNATIIVEDHNSIIF
jgi:hypothetical protein